MSQHTRTLPVSDYSPAEELLAFFRLKPAHRREVIFGFALRVVVGLFAIIIPSALLTIVGALNGWHLTNKLLTFYGLSICVMVLIGEHIRSRIYERSVSIVGSDQDASSLIDDGPVPNSVSRVPMRSRIGARTWSEAALKRLFDFLFALSGLVLLAPLMVVVAIAIRFDSEGPILFLQKRRDLSGRLFNMMKFRTMIVHDEETIASDRLTRMGRYLRTTSIDELPQLFNVLIGDMSIVGPRPLSISKQGDDLIYSLQNYAFSRRVKPGITGWAQINGYRGEARTIDSIKKRVEFDLWYIDHWSFWLDAKILILTLFEVLRARNAY